MKSNEVIQKINALCRMQDWHPNVHEFADDAIESIRCFGCFSVAQIFVRWVAVNSINTASLSNEIAQLLSDIYNDTHYAIDLVEACGAESTVTVSRIANMEQI